MFRRSKKLLTGIVSAAMILAMTTGLLGVTVSATGPVTIVGTGASYSTIQAAINAAAANDTILVSAGTYKEELSINKPLKLLGPNSGVSGQSSSRAAEAVITYPSLATATANGNLVDVESDNVTISGLSFNDGSYSDADTGIWTTGIYAHGNNDSITNNILVGFNYIQIWFSNWDESIGSSGNWGDYTTNDLVESNYTDNAIDYQSIYMQGASGTVRNNKVDNAPNAIQIQPYGNTVGGVVEDNTVNAYIAGIYYNYAETGSGTWNIQNNTIKVAAFPNPVPDIAEGAAETSPWAGLVVRTFGGTGFRTSSSNPPTVNFANNHVDGSGASVGTYWTAVYGLYMEDGINDSATAIFTGNTFFNVPVGAYKSPTSGGSLNLTTVLSVNTFTSNSTVSDDGNEILCPSPYSYSAQYYEDGQPMGALQQLGTAASGAQITASQLTNLYSNLPAGYKVDSTVGLPLTISADTSKNVISVYYVKNSVVINPGQTPTGSGTTITGNQTPAAYNPNTGDNSNKLPIAAALSGFAVIAGLSFLSIARKRKKA